MKQKDIALIIVVGFVSAVFALVASSFLFGSSQKQQKAEVADKITAEFTSPDDRYFNENSVDPTQPIVIGDNSNQSPFKQVQQ